MSEFKSEVLPSGVLIRKIKDDDDRFVLSSEGQAIIVSKLDIARMDGIVYPTMRLSEKCGIVPKSEEPVNTEKAWDNVEHQITDVKQQDTDAYQLEVRRIAEVLARIHYANAITSLYPAETWEGNPLPAKEWAISNKMEEARAMVSEICSALKKSMWDVAPYEMIPSIFDEGYMSVEQFREELKEHGLSDKYLIERGLIPAPEQFHCNNKVTDKGICTTQCDRCKVSDYHFQ